MTMMKPFSLEEVHMLMRLCTSSNGRHDSVQFEQEDGWTALMDGAI